MGKTSKVWAYAKRLHDSRVKCNLSEAILSAKGGSTSALRNHPVGTHHIDVDSAANSGSTPSISTFLNGPRQKIMN